MTLNLGNRWKWIGLVMTLSALGALAQAEDSELRPDEDIIPQEEMDEEAADFGPQFATPAEPQHKVFGKEKEDALKKRIQVVVHKTRRETGCQYMEVFVDEKKVHTFTVSTAWERKATAKAIDPATGKKKVYWPKTPEGVHTVNPKKFDEGMQPKRYSKLWKAWLPWVIRFNGGVWIHGTTSDHFAELGAPASGGCVRLHPENAKKLYDLVNAMGLDNLAITVLPPQAGEAQIRPSKVEGCPWVEPTPTLEEAVLQNSTALPQATR